MRRNGNCVIIVGCLLAVLCFGFSVIEAKAENLVASSKVTITGTLPVLYIETENHAPIVSKKEYINASYWLDPMGTEGVEAFGAEADPLPMQIRGRGHSSWQGRKKPYKIKLAQKAALMGMAANKHWALLKPTEHTLAGLKLGKLLDMSWTPSCRPVEVVMNGDYIGLYFLTETVRIGKNRVNIYEQQDQETDPDLIAGGWLVEIDNYNDECQIRLPEKDTWNMNVRYHSPEDLSDVQSQWLAEEFSSMNEAIYSSDKTSTDWEEYIDVESMARFFILQEIMDNPDGFHGSFYLHKDLGENARWVAGPAWDLLCYNRAKTDYTFRMRVHYQFTPHWIGEIIQYDSFCKAVESVWNEVFPARLSEIYEYIDEVLLPLEEAWRTNYIRWSEVPPKTADLAEKMKNALQRNITWFDGHLPVSAFGNISSPADTGFSGPAMVYNLQGVFVGKYKNEDEAISGLRRGIYIINHKKVIVD